FTSGQSLNPIEFCHKPLLIEDDESYLGRALSLLKVYPERAADDVIDDDLILLWGQRKKVITGADILGRLLRGIVFREKY
ncbi:MAG TPA: Mg2+ and Co2+ transporter CorB, partial [Gammaproteobacteria bacterium]|nr:Mg2+ and Co2+ transporter CorB [Gammaproteobacteria bacterium]